MALSVINWSEAKPSSVVIVAIITQALVIFRIDPFFVQVVLGLLILWTVGINRLRDIRLVGGRA